MPTGRVGTLEVDRSVDGAELASAAGGLANPATAKRKGGAGEEAAACCSARMTGWLPTGGAVASAGEVGIPGFGTSNMPSAISPRPPRPTLALIPHRQAFSPTCIRPPPFMGDIGCPVHKLRNLSTPGGRGPAMARHWRCHLPRVRVVRTVPAR